MAKTMMAKTTMMTMVTKTTTTMTMVTKTTMMKTMTTMTTMAKSGRSMPMCTALPICSLPQAVAMS